MGIAPASLAIEARSPACPESFVNEVARRGSVVVRETKLPARTSSNMLLETGACESVREYLEVLTYVKRLGVSSRRTRTQRPVWRVENGFRHSATFIRNTEDISRTLVSSDARAWCVLYVPAPGEFRRAQGVVSHRSASLCDDSRDYVNEGLLDERVQPPGAACSSANPWGIRSLDRDSGS